jgi:hypothetical protein
MPAVVFLLVQVQVILRQTISRPVCLGVGSPSGSHDQILATVRHLLSSCCGTPSLTRGRVCNLLLQFAVNLRSKSCRTHDHILLSRLRLYVTVSYDTSPTWRTRSLYLTPQEQGVPVIPPGTGLPFCRLLRS